MNKPRLPNQHSNPKLWHGGDYNPDQWLDRPDIIDEDFTLFPKAGVNVVSIGIFAWSRLEPSEGVYTFEWLDTLMDRLAQAGMQAVLATPSGAKPAWMSESYPEILRVSAARVKDLHGGRHNHCYSSPVYRQKAVAMNTKLAERYGKHPALALWHVSNEYGGECHCPLCQEAFRNWLKDRHGSLEELNRHWWTDFWSHRYSDWSQVESPSPQGETSVQGLNLDWKRFVDHQSRDFFLAESAPLRALSPDVPLTVNMMGTYPVLDYPKWAPHVDIISWDSYPRWHNPQVSDIAEAARTAFLHDLNRGMKQGQPWLLIESTPSQVNWQPVNRLKAPGMNRLSSLQAVAHGSDSVMYFQWRKGRGAAEKYHGAVVDHGSGDKTRVFQEVAGLGKELATLGTVAGSRIPAKAAILYDWENRWAIDGFYGFNQPERDYEGFCTKFHRGLWSQSISTDVLDQDGDFSAYRVLVAPMLHLVKPGVAKRLEDFVAAGGTLVLSFLSGWVDEHDLVTMDGFPGPLRKLAGIWAEELDPLWKDQENTLVMAPGNSLGLTGSYKLKSFCELIHAEGSEVLARYGSDWYKDRPVLTRNNFGKGKVYYLASQAEDAFVEDFMKSLARESALPRVVADLPSGVQASARVQGDKAFVFTMNWNNFPAGGLEAYGCRIEETKYHG